MCMRICVYIFSFLNFILNNRFTLLHGVTNGSYDPVRREWESTFVFFPSDFSLQIYLNFIKCVFCLTCLLNRETGSDFLIMGTIRFYLWWAEHLATVDVMYWVIQNKGQSHFAGTRGIYTILGRWICMIWLICAFFQLLMKEHFQFRISQITDNTLGTLCNADYTQVFGKISMNLIKD